MSDNYSDGAAVPAWKERKNLLLAGAVGLAVLLVGGYFVLSGGGSSDSYEPIPSAASAAKANGGSGTAASPSASSTAVPTVLPAVYDEDVYGDPFQNIYPPKATAAPTTAAAVSAPIVDVPVTTDTAGAAPVDEAKGTGETVSVKLVKVVDDDTVTVRVNGSKDNSTFNKGTEFGGYFTLTSTRADEDEATFTFGDGSPFTLSEGQTKKFVV